MLCSVVRALESFALAITIVAALSYAPLGWAQTRDLTEASGVIRAGESLLIVSDDDSEVYFRVSLSALDLGDEALPLTPTLLETVEMPWKDLFLDLEGIAVLGDGRIVVLSERLRALLDDEGIVFQYDDQASELANCGLEGVAVRRVEGGSSQVAVLWEGGYLLEDHLPIALQHELGDRSVSPFVIVAEVKKGVRDLYQRRVEHKVIRLDVPVPSGDEPSAQRFRAPDLVWSRLGDEPDKEWGFIVLLSSMSVEPRVYEHLWLQRFDLEGKAVGKPLDLDEVVDPRVCGFNWEGLAWYEEGRSLVLVNDLPQSLDGRPAIQLVTLPDDW